MMAYIDSEKVYEFAKEQRVKETGAFSKGLNKGLQIMMSAVRNRDAIPAADVVPVRHARWIPTHDADKLRCSKCDVIHLIAQYPHGQINYCPNCGCTMDGGQDE